jgi:SAM-dependent methyltransferase
MVEDRRAHWERVYREQDDTQDSWFQRLPAESLRLIEAAGLGQEARILDVGGGKATLVDALLEQGYEHVGVLDVSETAIESVRERLGPKAARVEWYLADMTEFISPHPWDLWHDRAVFHFLTSEEDQLAYRDALLGALEKGGQAVIGTFGLKGPPRCSGLDVCRYDAAALHDRLGGELELLEHVLVDHTTPGGAVQQFLFCRFRRT